MKWIHRLLLAAVFTLLLTITVYAGTWQKEGANWKYLKDDGNYAVKEWVLDNGKWYYLNDQGIMLASG